MIVISDSFALSPPAGSFLNTPIFGYRTIVTTASLAATSAATGFPVSNLANASTNLRWKAASLPAEDEYITLTVNTSDLIDYVGLAVHNFGTGGIAVSVEGATALEGSPEEPNWADLVSPRLFANDDPIIFRFAPTSLIGLRLRLQPGSAVPYLAVMYVGRLLVFERGAHQDYTPINLARNTEQMTGKSENGQFLGRVVISESRRSKFAVNQLESTWYRDNVDPLIVASKTTPFFFAWKPQEFPGDVGYCTLAADPLPVRAFDTGRYAIEFDMQGVAAL